MSAQPLNMETVAWRLAQDIPSGSYVNLGIGLPTMVAKHLQGAICHSENGVLGIAPLSGEADEDLINASKEPAGLAAGGAFFDHAMSFGMIRAGYIDVTVMGAFQVASSGDLANWSTGEALPAVGGAMDLAIGARQVFVIMRQLTREGVSKLVERCSYPLTAAGVVERVYTDLAVLRVADAGFIAEELAPGVTPAQLQAATEAPLTIPDAIPTYRASIVEAPA
ncbi:MAG TPA: CoA-transferase [Solirubrobacteraceae bacterium]|jgi:3-oxoacid CoA-transferase B subunit